jgi:flagellar basal-body rod protein FlgF/flagellar basal-body rod protein FlgG
MQNTLLVGLSKQMVLERQLDVVANNIANANTNGYKADRSLFQEYLSSNAHEDNFAGNDRRVSFVQDRATYRDYSQGPTEQTKNPLDVAIDGSGFLVVQTPAGERYTRDGTITFQQTDHDVAIAADGNITVLEGTSTIDSVRGRLRLVSFPEAQRLLKEGANLYAPGEGAAPVNDTKSMLRQGFVEKSNVNSVVEMSRMLEITRTYTQIATLLQQQSDLHKSAIEKLADVPT